jgi:hypothetical protein
MRRIFAALAAGLTALAVSACHHAGDYHPSADLTPVNAARIVGSKVETPSLIEADQRTYVAAVDSRPTRFMPSEYDVPLLVAAGRHTVQLSLSMGDFSSNVATRIELEAGKIYVARSEVRDRVASVWIEDELSGAMVGDKIVALALPITRAPTTVVIVPSRGK